MFDLHRGVWWATRQLLVSKQRLQVCSSVSQRFPWRNSIKPGGGLTVRRRGYQRPHSIARGGGIPLYPAIWGKPGTSITYKRRA
jgi:hypothetical protein